MLAQERVGQMRTESKTSSGLERRSSERESVLLRVDYGDVSGLSADYVTDVGDGGLFVRTELPFAIGQVVDLVLSFPDLLEPTPVRCAVRWIARIQSAQGERQTGVGMQFERSMHDDARLRGLIERLRGRAPFAPKLEASPLRVLFVDDNRFVSELFKRAISRFDKLAEPGASVEVVATSTATEAMRLLDEATEPPSLLVVDHFMPGMSGIELVERVRAQERFKSLPILMVSVGGKDVKQAAMAAGATLFVDKPVLLTQLIDTVKALLAKGEP